jgi:hypothetical protein
MAEKSAGKGARGPVTREDRLKAALKANMGRRKAQVRAREMAQPADTTDDAGQETPGNKE